jgi:flavin-binding protein dodecin
MSQHADPTYRLTEVVGTSKESIQQAVRNGVAKAAQTVRHLDWFQIEGVRGTIADGQVDTFQVHLKIGFRVDD